jgi:hypothetical protein
MLGNWDFSKVNKEEILHNCKQNPDVFIPDSAHWMVLQRFTKTTPGFHSSFEDFMDEWQEEENAAEYEF